MAQLVENLPAMQESACNVGDLGDLGWEDPLEKGRATNFNMLA